MTLCFSPTEIYLNTPIRNPLTLDQKHPSGIVRTETSFPIIVSTSNDSSINWRIDVAISHIHHGLLQYQRNHISIAYVYLTPNRKSNEFGEQYVFYSATAILKKYLSLWKFSTLRTSLSPIRVKSVHSEQQRHKTKFQY